MTAKRFYDTIAMERKVKKMSKENKEKGVIRWLKWPWNVLVYILLVLLLRIFAIPVIFLLMGWQKSRQPNGPEEGYCLQRTRRRLARLLWAFLYLVIGIACGVTFVVQMMSDRADWELTDYAVLAAMAVISIGALIMGIYEAYTDIRDALFPEKSRLAKSIRSQLPFPDSAPSVQELFAMVDKDIKEHGIWFDRVAVGQEWVFGDDVSYIPRIRVVFGRDEIKTHHSNGRTQTSRIIELYILDDRKQVQTTALRNPNELKALLDCLELYAPDALFRPYSEYFAYCGKSDIEWENLLREFQHRKNEREIAAWQERR